MSEDDIDSVIVNVIEWLEERDCSINWDDDSIYDAFSKLFYDKLEHFCTRERNYN